MKRFHVHVTVNDLDANIKFYSTVFGASPTVVKPDYAKWMVDDPRINFAISKRGSTPGIDHLGVQVDSDGELSELREQVTAAEVAVFDQADAACCYARSDKYWTTDPQGIAWETFHTLESIPVYGDLVSAQTSACCGAAPTVETASSKSGACCAQGGSF
ncbi:MAG: putative glyoxalase/bleomycin resistance protein/dioxygenase [Deltaproteobacteria bacterium]|nr:putative glyoxalase/bleomycin resistance protein/dioxygenase [Deltaproteobacteria bacterium]